MNKIHNEASDLFLDPHGRKKTKPININKTMLENSSNTYNKRTSLFFFFNQWCYLKTFKTLNSQYTRFVVVNIRYLTNKRLSYWKWNQEWALIYWLVTCTFSWWDFRLFGNSYFLFWNNFFWNFRHFKDISILTLWRITWKHSSHLHRTKCFSRARGCIHLS